RNAKTQAAAPIRHAQFTQLFGARQRSPRRGESSPGAGGEVKCRFRELEVREAVDGRERSMPSVAFATYEQEPEITTDDALVAAVLERAGVAVMPAVWDDPAVDWSAFDIVVIRSTWDYYLKADQFERWLQTFTPSGTQLWNPPEPVLWNMNKRYLL